MDWSNNKNEFYDFIIKNEVIGFCYTPQDGNSILSSITAAERFLYPETYEDKLRCLGALLLQEV